MSESGEFLFEPPSDEEIEHVTESKYEEEEDEEEAEHEEAEESRLYQKEVLKDGKTQLPWDFSSYSKSVAEEQLEWSTTSTEYKIKKAYQENPINTADDNDCDESAHFKSHHQEDHKPEDDDEPPAFYDGNGKKSFFLQVEGVSYNTGSFMELHLSRPLLRACQALGYSKPTPIQAACIPFVLTGRDICGSAITGSGKTAAFALPTLERLLYRPKNRPAIRVLILTPTRELATQVHSTIGKLAEFVPDIRRCLVFGGVPLKDQEAALRSLPDIVVATPGRMIDLLRNSMSVHLDELAVLILDEADRLLELGFNDKLHELVKLCPKRRQTLLFSATMSVEVDDLVKLSLNKPLRLSADPSTKRPATLTEEVVRIRRLSEGNQEAVLLALCSKTYTSKAIIFSGTKKNAHRLKILFGLAGLEAAEYHGDLPQAQRENALELFRKQLVDFLITTDIAARGLDIDCIQTVINFECPRNLISYVHRVGRTARAGREGYAVTFITDNDRSLIKVIKRDGSKLRGRIVAEQSIIKWSQIIEQMEGRISVILQEEREEMEIRKAEMEAKKVENMILHKDEIYSRPKRTWFTTEKEKKFVAKASKEALVNKKGSKIKKIISAEDAEKLRMKEKRKHRHE
ncbi:DEAD-box ATP-dependent RNA helicase 28 [Orobanche gracilis]